jgi:hypothetical protein
MPGDPAPSPATDSAAAGAAAPPRAPASLVGNTLALLGELGVALQDRALLLSLELRQAGLAITQMVMLAVMVALLLASAWFALMVGLFMAGMGFGLHWSVALGLVFLVNAGAAVGLWWKVRILTETLMLPATVRTIRAARSTPPQVEAKASADG